MISVSARPVVAPASLEARTLRKLRRRLIPFVFLLYIVAFVDRINIGFAALTMNGALGISKEQFGFLTGIFFAGYFLFEIPSNLLLHKIGPRIWIARILVTWGILSMLTSAAQSVGHLYLLRFMLGVAEAGFFPGIILYLTYWFRSRDQAQAVALFMTAVPIANILGAPISGYILDHVTWLGLSSWRWLFVLEGLPAVLLGILTCLVLPNRPAEARFLTQEECAWLTRELAAEEKAKVRSRPPGVLSGLADRRVWHLASIYFASLIGSYGLIFWLPQIIQSLSHQWSNTVVGSLAMIPYVAGLTAMILVSRHSDRTRERRYHIAGPVGVAAIALVGLSFTRSPVLSIVLLAIGTMGIESNRGPFWSVPNQFLTGYSAAAGIALVNSFGNLGGFFGPYVVGAISKKTGGDAHAGLAILGAFLLLSAVLAARLPKQKDAGAG